MREPFFHRPSFRQLGFPRLGLAAAGAVMLVGAFPPCLEIFGESSSAFELAAQGAAFPWLWLILGLPLLLLVSLFVRPPLFAILAGVLAALGPIVAVTMARVQFGPFVWQTLRSGSWLLLTGACLSLLFAGFLAVRSLRQSRQ